MNGSTAIVGIGQSEFARAGRSPHSSLQLATIAIRRAAEDAGLALADLDGLVTYNNLNEIMSAPLASVLGFRDLRFAADPMSGGGNLAAAALMVADAAVTAGYADHVVVFRSINQGGGRRYGRARFSDRAEGEAAHRAPYGLSAPVAANALLAQRFMHDHGIEQDTLANLALASYAHAQANPHALMYGKPLTREAYHASRWIAEPFHLFDCCQESDGACAVIVSSAERARDLRQRPAYLRAAAAGMTPRGGLRAFNDDAYPDGRFRSTGEQLWARAGVRPADVDVVQLYENFTGSTLMAISDLGFCAPEELNDFVTVDNLSVGGAMPYNTSGGNLAEAYIHGFQLANEAVRQLRGDSVNQVPGAELCLMAGGPGTPPSSAVLLGSIA